MATVLRLAVQALQIRSCGNWVCCMGSCFQHLLFVVFVNKVFAHLAMTACFFCTSMPLCLTVWLALAGNKRMRY